VLPHDAAEGDSSLGNILGEHNFVPKGSENSVKFIVTRGDFSPLMSLMVDQLERAKVSHWKLDYFTTT